MKVGFIHGVMNTDNTSVVGETIDYGPCAFLDSFDPQAVFSSIDQHGRYSYSNQPAIAQWNLARLAETLLPLISEDQDEAVALATAAVSAFSGKYEQQWLSAMRSKLGLIQALPGDGELIGALLAVLHALQADYTLSFHSLASLLQEDGADSIVDRTLQQSRDFQEWLRQWRIRSGQDSTEPELRLTTMRQANPKYIPRNHRIEAVIESATAGDFGPFHALLAVVVRPFDDQPHAEEYAMPPRPEERVLETFCGT
jgi:uncharacterized protein YdiU (UPF0061 family)